MDRVLMVHTASGSYEPVEKRFKVLMQVHNSSGHAQSFIFSLSIDKSWRKIKDIINFFPCYSMKNCSIKEFIYMMDYSKNSIVAFDLRAGNFRVIGLGDDICKNIFDYDWIEVKGKIALLDFWGSFTEESWHSHSFAVERCGRYIETKIWQGFCDSRDGEIIFIAVKNNILFCYFHDVGKISWRYLEIHGAPIEDEINGINIYSVIIFNFSPRKKMTSMLKQILHSDTLYIPLNYCSLGYEHAFLNFFNALVLDSNFTYVHHRRSMIRDGGTKFLIGKTEIYMIKRKMIVLPYRRKNSHSTKSLYYYSLGYEPNSRGHILNFVFTLSIDKTWRKIKSINDVFFPCFTKKSNDICDNRFNYDLIEVKGKLALLDCCECFTGRNDLWILENFEKEEWKSHAIHVPSQWKVVEDIPKPLHSSPQVFYDSPDDEIIFIVMNVCILACYFYDVGKNRWRHLEIHGIPREDRIYGINFYVESLNLC
ncbi:hypothetical protein H5410_060691 [Solanum commersonii]|uniref:F-box associated beta-propeller type 3 domain-containing protein n=1 Tax=Solanum commersonii TaxID=4109 RepID=A0A9J5W5R2_SOLCO|nr:hypothetical protein H5410_060691 [Solanum commersonii]